MSETLLLNKVLIKGTHGTLASTVIMRDWAQCSLYFRASIYNIELVSDRVFELIEQDLCLFILVFEVLVFYFESKHDCL